MEAPRWKRESLHGLVLQAAAAFSERIAIEEPRVDRRVTYGELEDLSKKTCDVLRALRIGRGARVGLCVSKSIDAVATLLGILRAGAAYVPIDPGAPMSRGAYIAFDCELAAVFVEASLEPALRAELAALRAAGGGEAGGAEPVFITIDAVGGGDGLRAALEGHARAGEDATSERSEPDELAYILYTSGSTGRPKGVMLTHENAVSFVEWARALVQPVPEDKFSSHAPLHFDLSILDLYVCLSAGATLVLVEPLASREPRALGQWISRHGITVWYSAPSILTMLAHYGRLKRYDFSALRMVLFAGEVFPVKHLRALKALWPQARYYNLYGPTETNVCTYHEIPAEVPAAREQPYPIGRACSHLDVRLADADGRPVAAGEEGEVQVKGPGVTQGYWNLPERTSAAFTDDGWYRTGDIASADAAGALVFIGRRDRMVKRRGYRVELGEIESALYRHEHIAEAAVLAFPSEDAGVRIKAFIVAGDPSASLTLLAIKQFCAEHVPLYMLPDRVEVLERLPKTSTDKVDYQALKRRG